MKVYYDSMQGPQRCKVIREDGDFVELEPLSPPSGPFGFIEPHMRRFTTHKSQCWKKARALNQYSTRHELIGKAFP